MLKSMQIKNFKGWKDTGHFRLAPLTVIFGANSAGKSSLGHLLLALKQTTQSNDNKRSLHLGDEKSMIDLGTFKECLHNQDLTQPLAFQLEWQTNIEIKNPLDKKVYAGDSINLYVEFTPTQNEQPHVSRLEYKIQKDSKQTLNLRYANPVGGKAKLDCSPLKLVRTNGRARPLEDPVKFYRISDQTRSRFQNADFLADLALETETIFSKLQYLGPLREHPKRTYLWSGETPENVGQNGELAIAALLAAIGEERRLNRGAKMASVPFEQFIAKWLKDLGIIHDFSVKPVAKGRKEYEVLIKTHPKSSEVKITDVGFGVSQVLPALILAFYCKPDSTVWMEQPETHLHPQVQAELADVFISAVQACENGNDRNIQLIIESHSEHFLNRLQRRIAEGLISPDDVAVYFCKRATDKTELEPLQLNMFGDIENWPDNFFGDDMADITARTLAAIEKRKSSLAGTSK